MTAPAMASALPAQSAPSSLRRRLRGRRSKRSESPMSRMLTEVLFAMSRLRST